MNLLHVVEAFTKGLVAVKGSIDLLKTAKDLMPEGDQKVSLGKKIEEAEHSLQLANAEMGKSLGYQLCRCTWPPQVMLSIGYFEEKHVEQWKCSQCGKIIDVAKRAQPTKRVAAFDPYDIY